MKPKTTLAKLDELEAHVNGGGVLFRNKVLLLIHDCRTLHALEDEAAEILLEMQNNLKQISGWDNKLVSVNSGGVKTYIERLATALGVTLKEGT